MREVPYLLIVVLFVPLCLAIIYNGWLVGACIFASSLIVARLTRRTKTPSSRRMILLTLLVNQLVVIHSVYHYRRTVINGVDLDALSASAAADHKPRPFVSIVVFQNPNWSDEAAASTFASLQTHSSTILSKEIVVPDKYQGDRSGPIPVSSEISGDSDFVIFVAPGVHVSADWMNGMVREFIANSNRLVVPFIQEASGAKLAGTMISSKRGELVRILVTDFMSRSIPIVPFFSVIGVPRDVLNQFPDLPRLISEGRVVEASLRAWLCYSGIILTRFSHITVSNPFEPDWKVLEGLDVDERITGCGHDKDWFYSEFKEHDADAEVDQFMVSQSDSCLSVTGNGKLSFATPCNPGDPNQLFDAKSNFIRSVASGQCLDAASALKPGKEPLLYVCMMSNRNQAFSLAEGRLMWGSFCLEYNENRFSLEECEGFEEAVKPTQRWDKKVIAASQ